MASLWSAVEKQCFSNANDVSSTRLTVSRKILLTETLVPRIACVGPVASRCANVKAVAMSCSAGTTRLMSPMRSASAAVRRSPVSKNSLARAAPTSQGQITAPPSPATTPIRTCGSPTLALFSDVIFAADNARIGDPHVRIGVVAGDGGAVIWPWLVGAARAKEFLLTGDLLTAAEAERIGLINRVVAADQLMATALTFAQRLATGPTQAIRGTKSFVNNILSETDNLVLYTSLALERHFFSTADHKEAIQAFVEKREPRFTGR